VIARLPGEESCLSLVWAVLDPQINNACNGVKLSETDRQRLHRLRHEPGQSEAKREQATAAQTDLTRTEAAAKLQRSRDATRA
jgi:hypothetical protein